MFTKIQQHLKTDKVVYLLLTVVAAALYLPSLYAGFSPLDEQWLLINNTNFLSSDNGIKEAFSQSILQVYYRPLLMVGFVIEYRLFQLQPFGYHLGNLILLITSACLFFRVLSKFSGERMSNIILSLVFVSHPLLVHATTWIPGRNDLLLSVFVFFSLLVANRYLQSGQPGLLLMLTFAYCLALFTKETAVVLPVIILPLAYSVAPRKALLMVLPGLISVGIWWYFRSQLPLKPVYPPQSFFVAFKNSFLAVLFNLGKMVLPVEQSVSPRLQGLQLVASLLGCVVLLLLFIKSSIRSKPLTITGGLLLLLFLIPVTWFSVHSPLQEQYEHRLVVPLAGLLLVFSQVKAYGRIRVRKILLAACVLFAIKTLYRQPVYKSEISYLREGTADCPENYLLQTQLGNQLMLQKNFAEALRYYNTAVARFPDKAQVLNSRANAFVELGKKDSAIADYTKALHLSDYHYSVYMSRCWAYWRFNDVRNAYKDMQGILQRYPDKMDPALAAEINQAVLKLQVNDLSNQITKTPSLAALYIERAQVYYRSKNYTAALSDSERACALEPGNKLYRQFYENLKAGLAKN